MSDDSDDDDSQVSKHDASQAEAHDPDTCTADRCFDCSQALLAAAEEKAKALAKENRLMKHEKFLQEQPSEDLADDSSGTSLVVDHFKYAFDDPLLQRQLRRYIPRRKDDIASFSSRKLFGFSELLVRTDCVISDEAGFTSQEVVGRFHSALLSKWPEIEITKSLAPAAHLRYLLDFSEWRADPSQPFEYLSKGLLTGHRLKLYCNSRVGEYRTTSAVIDSELRKDLLAKAFFLPCVSCIKKAKSEWSPTCDTCQTKRPEDVRKRLLDLAKNVTANLRKFASPVESAETMVSEFGSSFAALSIVGSQLYRYKRLFPDERKNIAKIFKPLFRSKQELPEILFDPDHERIITEFIKRAGDPLSAGDSNKTFYVDNNEVLAIMYVTFALLCH